jgi:hypothetical protein
VEDLGQQEQGQARAESLLGAHAANKRSSEQRKEEVLEQMRGQHL